MHARIQKAAQAFRAIFLFFFLLVPILIGGLWLACDEITMENGAHSETVLEMLILNEFDMIDEVNLEFPLPWKIRLLGLAVDMIPLSITMLSLWWLIHLFTCFANGQIFTESTVKYIRYLGWTMVVGVVATPIHEALMTAVLTMHNPPGEQMIGVSLESTDFEDLIVAGIIILVSWIMEEGRRLRESDELTV